MHEGSFVDYFFNSAVTSNDEPIYFLEIAIHKHDFNLYISVI